MQRIDDATAAPSLPVPEAAGTPGYFTEGNPTAGTPATNVRGSWLNMVQEELMNVVVAAGLTPSKTTYTQLRDAIKSLVGSGRLLNVQTFSTSGTYTPTAGTSSILVWLQGAGGGGGGVQGLNTSGVASASQPGSAGSFAMARFLTGFSGAAVTIGVGGAGGPAGGSNGTTGGTSSFGALLSCPGGPGGIGATAATTPPQMIGGGSLSSSPSGSGILMSVPGGAGTYGTVLSASAGAPAVGGKSFLGYGGQTANGSAGNPGALGGGGSAAMAPGTFTTGLAGGKGGDGFCIVYELS